MLDKIPDSSTSLSISWLVRSSKTFICQPHRPTGTKRLRIGVIRVTTLLATTKVPLPLLCGLRLVRYERFRREP